ncbi:MAG: MFS transporter [Halieaceae bacterium]|nr:MFS transporter [Halieaceae bacterium]
MSSAPSTLLLYTSVLVGVAANAVPIPTIPDVLSALGGRIEDTGLYFGIGAIPGIVLAPISGYMAGRCGARNVLVILLLVTSVAGGLSGFAMNTATLMWLRLIQGCGSAGVINLVLILIAENFDGTYRRRALGMNAAVMAGGSALLPFASGLIAEGAGWRWSFHVFWLGLIPSIAAIVLLPRADKREQFSWASIAVTARILEQERKVHFALLTGLLSFMIMYGGFVALMPVHLLEIYNFGPGLRGLVFGTAAIGNFAGSIAQGYIRLTSHTLIVLGFLLLAASLAGFATSPALALLIVAIVIYGLAQGMLLPPMQNLAGSPRDIRAREMGISIWAGCARAGQTIGPLVTSWLLIGFTTSAVFAIYAAAAISAGACSLFARGPLDSGTDN